MRFHQRRAFRFRDEAAPLRGVEETRRQNKRKQHQPDECRRHSRLLLFAWRSRWRRSLTNPGRGSGGAGCSAVGPPWLSVCCRGAGADRCQVQRCRSRGCGPCDRESALRRRRRCGRFPWRGLQPRLVFGSVRWNAWLPGLSRPSPRQGSGQHVGCWGWSRLFSF